ncbi:hypothetical protein [Azospirillum picis]|uniref:Uncharacterized protein n=1 Tax=Azospirillum picis TaxID=488438 RepID=A0ABU0MPW0_9PROT|nr:hypothetical protein [Azospirillum picis]MBP2301730.1 hypothetical protein [Azospirillum picis]MDQ0535446.1 hypothetical protein [Azospirillum picis]
MWQDYTNALITAFGLSGLAFGIGKIAVVLGERAIERRHGAEGVRNTIVRRAKMETRFESRRSERIAELKELDGAVEDVLRRRKMLEKQIEDSRQSGERLVRLIGEEVQGSPCYIVMVVNRYVGNGTFQQSQHALIDASWSQPQTVEVWARSMAEARAEIERRYPPAFGYAVTRMQEILSADTPVAKAS